MLPGVHPGTPGPTADATVHQAPVASWSAAESIKADSSVWQCVQDGFRLSVPGTGRFAAVGGTRLVVDPAPGIPLSAAVTYLLGTTLAALLYQRGGIALHASAICVHNRAHLILAPSGHGKSTLSAVLSTMGCTLLCDDMARIAQIDDQWVVYADHRRTKLHEATIAALGLQTAADGPVGDISGKHFVRLPRSDADFLPLGTIFSVSVDPTGQEPTIAPMNALHAANHLLHRTYRGAIHRALVPGPRIAHWTAALSQFPGLLHVVRPGNMDSLPHTAGLLREAMDSSN